MSYYAFLYSDLICTCGNIVSDTVFFQWGYCAGFHETEASTYTIGESIRWHTTPDGHKPAWTSFRLHQNWPIQNRRYEVRAGINRGDPTCKNVIITFHACEGEYRYGSSCLQCGCAFAGSSIRIEDGRIVEAWLFSPGDPLDLENVDIFLDDGDTRTPKPEWYEYGNNVAHFEVPLPYRVMEWLRS